MYCQMQTRMSADTNHYTTISTIYQYILYDLLEMTENERRIAS